MEQLELTVSGTDRQTGRQTDRHVSLSVANEIEILKA